MIRQLMVTNEPKRNSDVFHDLAICCVSEEGKAPGNATGSTAQRSAPEQKKTAVSRPPLSLSISPNAFFAFRPLFGGTWRKLMDRLNGKINACLRRKSLRPRQPLLGSLVRAGPRDGSSQQPPNDDEIERHRGDHRSNNDLLVRVGLVRLPPAGCGLAIMFDKHEYSVLALGVERAR